MTFSWETHNHKHKLKHIEFFFSAIFRLYHKSLVTFLFSMPMAISNIDLRTATTNHDQQINYQIVLLSEWEKRWITCLNMTPMLVQLGINTTLDRTKCIFNSMLWHYFPGSRFILCTYSLDFFSNSFFIFYAVWRCFVLRHLYFHLLCFPPWNWTNTITRIPVVNCQVFHFNLLWHINA